MAEMSLREFNNQPKTSPRKWGIPRVWTLVGAVVVIAGLSFYSGVLYQKGKNPATKGVQATAASQYGRNAGGAGGFQRGNRAVGTVTAISSSSITLQTRNGTSKTYTITSSTTVTNGGQSDTVGDVQSGDTVFLTLDSSNTQDVTSIMLNPSFGGGFGGAPSQTQSNASSSASGTTGV